MRIVATLAAAALSAVVASSWSNAAPAQEWPAKPVRVVVPFPAGGSTDRMTRLVAEELTKVFKQQFVVENRPGAGGAVGAAQVARAEPDGYTLMAGGFGPHILGPASGVKVDYDPIADFTHIVMMGGESYIFAAHSALGVKSLADVVRLASDKPINFGSPGTGTLGQLMVDQFRLKVGSEPDQPRALSRRRAAADRFHRQSRVARDASDRADAAAHRGRHDRAARSQLERAQSGLARRTHAQGGRLSGDRRRDLVLARWPEESAAADRRPGEPGGAALSCDGAGRNRFSCATRS